MSVDAGHEAWSAGRGEMGRGGMERGQMGVDQWGVERRRGGLGWGGMG